MKQTKEMTARGDGPSRLAPRRERWGRILAALVVLLAYAFFYAPTPAASSPSVPPLPTWTPMVADGPAYFTNMTGRTLAYMSNGTPCVAFGGDGLWYSCRGANNVWNTKLVDSAPRVGEYASLAFNTNNWPFISYYDAVNGKLKLAYSANGGSSWTILLAPTPVPTVALRQTPDQAVEATFWDMEQERLAAALDPSEMTPEQPHISLTSFGAGKHTSIGVDVRNWVYITYFSDYDGALWLALYNGDPMGNPWEFHKLDDYNDQGRVGLWSSIAIEYRDNTNIFAHISYMDEKYDDLKYAYWKFSNRSKQIYTVESAPRVGSFSSIALLDGDTPVISYLEFITVNGKITGKLKFAKSLSIPNNTWAITTVDSVSEKTGWYTSIAVDCGDRIHISYFDPAHGNLRYAVYQNNGWVNRTAQEGVGLNGLFTSIAIHPLTCLPAISYLNGLTGEIQFTQRGSGVDSWSEPPAIVAYRSRDVGIASSMAFRTDGQVYASYLDITAGQLKTIWSVGNFFVKNYPYPYSHAGPYTSSQRLWKDAPRVAFYDEDNRDLIYGAWVNAGWVFTRIDSSYDVGLFPSLQLDSGGWPHMSYYDSSAGNLNYAYYNPISTRWVTETVDIVNDVGRYSSLALSAGDIPRISYYDDTSNALKYAYKTDIGAWVVRTVENPLGVDVGWYTSLALDNGGNPQISYYDKTNGDLKFASWNGATWDISSLQTTDDVGLYTAMKINRADNTRHMCYYDYTNGNLMYARWTAGLWEFQVVDGNGTDVTPFLQGDVGPYCSIDLDTAGNPGISYYDNSRGDLRVALSSGGLPLGEYYLPIIVQPGP